MTETENVNRAPFPTELADLVSKIKYRPGWECHLYDRDRGQGSKGLTLDIITLGYDTYHPERGQKYRVRHSMIVPAASYNRQSWQRWLLEMHLLVERHECCEFFQIDGERPYGPHHGEGWDCYAIFEHASLLDRRTRYTNEVNASDNWKEGWAQRAQGNALSPLAHEELKAGWWACDANAKAKKINPRAAGTE